MAIQYWIIGLSALCIVLNVLPEHNKASYYIKAILGLPNTLIHEFCHAFMALITFGKVKQLKLFSSGAGEAVSLTGSWLSRVLVTLAGYTGASAVSYGFVRLWQAGHIMWIFYIFSVLCVFTLFYIRNSFGFLYVLLLNAAWLGMTHYHYDVAQRIFTYYLIIVCLAYSVSSALTICKISFLAPSEAGDAANMKEHTYIPAQVWGVLFLVQAIFFYYMSVRRLLP